MRTKRFAYFLILLLFWALVDNYWDLSPTSQSRVLVDDDDEYISTGSLHTSQQSSWRDGSLYAQLVLSTFVAAPPCAGERTDVNFSGHFGPPCLYVFMSMQR
jgi:hypothetical protein